MLQGMELFDAHPRDHPLNRNPRVGASRKLGPLVSLVRGPAGYVVSRAEDFLFPGRSE